jgi:hypothetical protein
MDPYPAAFEADPLLEGPDTPVLGLNVAFHWPLPAAFRGEYDSMRARLRALDPGVYVYPFEQTHVTVATIVSFKRHARPDGAEQDRILSLLPRLTRVLDEACAPLRPFEIAVGAPVLVPAAAFLPITNATGEVAAVRRHLAAAGAFPELQVPRAIHSTILRFQKAPRDPPAFIEHFDEIARSVRFGTAEVHALVVTTETRRYMMAGRIVHQAHLKLPA